LFRVVGYGIFAVVEKGLCLMREPIGGW
jgi:hypothetical protein